MNNIIVEVRKALCLGCGLCEQICPTGAISLSRDGVQIDHNRCNHCRLCIDVCPRGALTELAPVSGSDLAQSINALKLRMDSLDRRIEKLRSRVN